MRVLGALGLPAGRPWAAEVVRTVAVQASAWSNDSIPPAQGRRLRRTYNFGTRRWQRQQQGILRGASAPGGRKEARKSVQSTPSPDAWFLVDHYGRPRRTAPGHQERAAHVPGTMSSNHLLMLEMGGATLRGAVTRPRLSTHAIAPPSVPLKAVRRPGDQLVQCHAPSRFQEPNLALLWPMACHHMGLISHPRLLDATPPAWPYARATLAADTIGARGAGHPIGRDAPVDPLAWPRDHVPLRGGPRLGLRAETEARLQTRGPGRATRLTRRRAGWALQLPTGACHLGSEVLLRLRACDLFLFIGLRQGGGAGGGKGKREYKKGVVGGG